MRRKTVFILVSILLSLSPVFSATINLGSIGDVTELRINKGGEGVFQLSFFTLGEDPVKVKIMAEYPDDLKVDIIPEEFVLRKEVTTSPYTCERCGWFVLKDGKTYAKTTPVFIHVRVPYIISRNIYKIKVTALATSLNEESPSGMGQTITQSREFTLTAFVPGSIGVPPMVNYSKPEVLTIERREGEGNFTPTTITGRSPIPTGFITLPKEEVQNVQNWILVILLIGVAGLTIKKLLM